MKTLPLLLLALLLSAPAHAELRLGDTTTLHFATQGNYQIEVWGELTAGPTDCGLECWTLDYGAGTIEARLPPGGYLLGDCVHWIGPYTQYFGEDQLDASDFDWVRYF